MIKYVAIIIGITVFIGVAFAAVNPDDGGKKVVKIEKVKKCTPEEGCTTIEMKGDHNQAIWKSIKDIISGKVKHNNKKVVKFGDHVVVCDEGKGCDCRDDDCHGDCDEDCCGDCDEDCELECEALCELGYAEDCCEDEDVVCTVGGDGRTKTIKITRFGDEVRCEELCDGKWVERDVHCGDEGIDIIHGGEILKLLRRNDGAHAELLLKGLHQNPEGKLLKLKGEDGEVLLKLLHEGDGEGLLEGIHEEHADLLKRFDVPKPPVAPRPPHREMLGDNERKLHHLKAAAENLHAAGMHQEAERLMQRVKALEKARQARRAPEPRSSVRGNENLQEAIQDLRRQVQELHRVVRDLKERMEDVKSRPARYRLRSTSDSGAGRVFSVPHLDGEVSLGIAVGSDEPEAVYKVIPGIKVLRGEEAEECIECDCSECEEECEEIVEVEI